MTRINRIEFFLNRLYRYGPRHRIETTRRNIRPCLVSRMKDLIADAQIREAWTMSAAAL